ncbi:hypothetical protein [Rhizorhapis suberifaciens]|uniref:hypothetical protein n=1 Tax=Rhizorhapis suberifaciens TaxID=13656 RepID=UPI001FE9F3F4|nr:hypothetical protein [Rhizorhapis suberifaciens]
MKRRLVLGMETARHPFRRTLPPTSLSVNKKDLRASDDQDWKLFALSFSAFFTAFYTFIA